MKLIKKVQTLLAIVVTLNLHAQQYALKNTRAADPLTAITIAIESEQDNVQIYLSGVQSIFDSAELQFNYHPKYLDCLNCTEHNFYIVYELIGEYTFGGHAGSKTFSASFIPTSTEKKFPLRGLSLLERTGEPLIAASNLKRSMDAKNTIYIKLLEIRGYVLNNSIKTDKKSYRLGKLFKS